MSSTAFTSATLRLSRPARIGKYFLMFSTISIGWAGPPRSRGSMPASSEASIRSVIAVLPFELGFDVHRLAQAVADQVEGNGGDEDGDAGDRGDQRLHVDRLPERRQHQAPVRRRRRHA